MWQPNDQAAQAGAWCGMKGLIVGAFRPLGRGAGPGCGFDQTALQKTQGHAPGRLKLSRLA